MTMRLTTIACLDAYEATSDITYFRSGEQIAEQMIRRFYDREVGGFFDNEPAKRCSAYSVHRAKPFRIHRLRPAIRWRRLH